MGNSKSKKTKATAAKSSPAMGNTSTATSISTTPATTPEPSKEATTTYKEKQATRTQSQPINVSPVRSETSNASSNTSSRLNRPTSNLSVHVPKNSLEGYAHILTPGEKEKKGSFNNSHRRTSDEDQEGKKIPTLPAEILEGAFDDHWVVSGEVGQGATSRVYKCSLVSNPDVKAACKVVNKNRLGFGRRKKKVLEHIRNEILVLKSLRHPCIIRMMASYESDDYIHIVTELMEGGELFEYIVDEASELNEETASNIVCRVARALRYMHDKGVLHRDLKPENLLLRTKGDTSQIKIIDFGFSKNCERTQSFLGTHGYLAPEMMAHEAYTTAVDMWALGVCAYALMSGYLPFDEMEPPEPGCEIEWIVQFPEEQWSEVTEEAKDLIRRLLEPDPQKRYTAEQVLKHPWIPGFGTPVPSVHSRRSTQLLSPANLRMLSPAKSARRTGGWKFWDDSASRRSSPSISSAGRSVSGDRASSPMFWGSAMTPSPGNPSPLRMEVSDGTGNSFKIPSDGDGGSGSGSARSVRSGSKRVSFELPSVEENSFGISIPMEDTEDFDNQESPTKIGRSENGSPLAQTIDPNEISTPMKTCTSKEVDLIDGHEAIMRSPSGEGKEALSAPSDGKE